MISCAHLIKGSNDMSFDQPLFPMPTSNKPETLREFNSGVCSSRTKGTSCVKGKAVPLKVGDPNRSPRIRFPVECLGEETLRVHRRWRITRSDGESGMIASKVVSMKEREYCSPTRGTGLEIKATHISCQSSTASSAIGRITKP